jgi:oxalate decarboxylase/phosphoglucose isomerase-like protein (cupin superfamily)
MFKAMIRPAILALAITATTAAPTKRADVTAMQQALILAPSYQDREAILFPDAPDASNILYQFVDVGHKAPTGGEVVLASVDNFPALVGTNVAAAVGFIDACGLNVPHSHPRANEILTVVEGTLVAGLVLEQTAGLQGDTAGTNPTAPLPMVNATISDYTAILFPQGQVHFQFNPTCKPAVFVAAFDNSDSGRIQAAQAFFSIQPDDVLIAALGGNTATLSATQIDKLRGNIPDAFAELMADCAKTCGISTS